MQQMGKWPMSTVPENASIDDKAKVICDVDETFAPMMSTKMPGLEAVEEQVVSKTWHIPGVDGNQVALHMSRPKGAAGDAVLPCVYHVHGGGMSMLSTADRPFYQHCVQLVAKGVC